MESKPAEKKFEDIAIGESASFAVTITPEMVEEFAKISGDYNPLHTDEEYAAATPFGRRIAHGMIAGALFSRLLGMHLPGLYGVYLSQTLQFKKPVLINAQVVVKGTVKSKSDAAKTLTVTVDMRDAKTAELLVGGEALVQVLK